SDVRIETVGSVADTVLAAAGTCAELLAGPRWGCHDDIITGTVRESRIWLHRVPAGRFYLLVDGYDGTATGAFTVNVSAVAAAEDACAAPIDISGGGRLIGRFDASAAAGTERGGCAPAGSGPQREAVATFTPDGSRVDFQARSADFSPIVYVRETCADPASELACATVGWGGGMTANLNARPPAAPHWVFVDGAAPGAAYTLLYSP
ncbi:MAG: hypothetical protein OEY14_14315, partial [Myxococcales bacterium]|nr:hypothetical protein [Myxococcales bacterium]